MHLPNVFALLLVILNGLPPSLQQQEEIYHGRFLRKFNTYHTQILGDVYIVDMYTIFIKGFSYDGKSHDAYFTVGSTLRPSNKGYIVANEEGKTNVLLQYINKDITLKLPKAVTDIKWIAIYDHLKSRTLADVTIPEGYEPPSSQTISAIKGHSHGVTSEPVNIINSKMIEIPGFSYDGTGSDVYFWVGKGANPKPTGYKLPDENGYLSPLRRYDKVTITLELPGNMTVFTVNWLSVWDLETSESFGSVNFPKEMTIPPALVNVIVHENRLPNCEQLHRHLHVSWEVFGTQITIELAGMIGENDYMAFGISGAYDRTQMVGSDAAITYIDGWQGIAVDYNITEKAPCTQTVQTFRGACPDLKVGGLDDLQFIMHQRQDNITVITYRRNLLSADSGDKNYTESNSFIVWAVGHLGNKKEPLYHYLYPKGNAKLDFGRNPPSKSCYYFTTSLNPQSVIKPNTWKPLSINNPSATNFSATLGPSGGPTGYEAITGMPSQQLAWYINGLLIPEIYVKRNKKYTFIVEGGNDFHSAIYNNPLYISNDPEGGHDRLTSIEQKRVRIYAGVNFERRDAPNPYAGGRLCLWENRSVDMRMVNQFPVFERFRSILRFRCDEGNPGILEWIPNKTTPNTVYYHSYKQPYMGWKINVIDAFQTSKAFYSCPIISIPIIIIFVAFLLV